MNVRKITLPAAVAGGVMLCVRVMFAWPVLLQEPSPVVINEVQADPATGAEGDANGDGLRDTYEDEFIELVNRSSSPADVSGFELGTAGADPFVFPAGTILAPGEYLVVFGGGTPTGIPGRAFTAGGRLGSGLTNTAGRILLIDPAGPDTLQDISYQGWDVDGAFTRNPEGWGEFVEHLLVSGARFSPAGPALPGGGPDQSRPTAYRIRVVNLTSAGYQVAWRTSSQADGRLEVGSGGFVKHMFDPLPSGLLHMAGIYGLEPLTPTMWRVVSGGTIAPSDSFQSMTTGHVVTSVPYTVYGTVADGATGSPVGGVHVFLRSWNVTGPSGWMAAVTDSNGRWNLNLGNLRTVEGEAYPWSTGDTLRVEVDGGSLGVASAEVLVGGTSPQDVPTPGVEPDSPPVFSWDGLPIGSNADTTIVLGYELTDEGEAWARVYLRLDGQADKIVADTEPSLLPASVGGSVVLTVSDLPEGSLWWISALVEDGLNPPFWVQEPQPLRISHTTDSAFIVPAGVALFTPTLDDTLLQTAFEWLGRLPSSGELARWDLQTASWISAGRLSDGTLTGGDFQLTAGEGYALVSAIAGSLQVNGPRRYGPPVLHPGTGLALVGVSDSTLVRTAGEVLTDPQVRAVSRWDAHSQLWQGRFRLPGGEEVGDDFLIDWGEAVAIDLDSTITWQPAGALRSVGAGRISTFSRPRSPATAGGSGNNASLLAACTDPGCVDLLWRAPPGAYLKLESDAGNVVWQASGVGEVGWRHARVTGLSPGRYQAFLSVYESDGERRLIQHVRVERALPPPLPVWSWGDAPSDPGPLLLEIGGSWIPARSGPDGIWYAPLGRIGAVLATADPGAALIELASDGGWTRWPLSHAAVGDGQVAFSTDGPPLALGGIEIEEEGPLSLKLRWQVLQGDEAVSFQPFLGYESPRGGGGPHGDPRQWVPAGDEIVWEPGQPPVMAQDVRIGPGPEGQLCAGAVAVRVTAGEGRNFWLGPGALSVPAAEEELMLLPAAPNPFNPETLLRYTLPPGGIYEVRMEIRDVRGRRIRILVDSAKASGSYMVRWDGRDDAGHAAAAGIYLVLLQVDGRRLSRKILLLR